MNPTHIVTRERDIAAVRPSHNQACRPKWMDEERFTSKLKVEMWHANPRVATYTPM